METLPPTCSPPDLPRPVSGHTAVWLPTGLLVCGGGTSFFISDISDVTSACHHWSNGTWEPAQAMERPRHLHISWAPPSLQGKVLHVGDGVKSSWDTGEVWPEGRVFDLAHRTDGSCGVAIGQELIVISGHGSTYVTKYDATGEVVEELEQLPEYRYDHSCWANTAQTRIYVAGGYDSSSDPSDPSDRLSSSLRLVLTGGGWQEVGALPRTIRGGRVLGNRWFGGGDEVYKFDESDETWKEESTKLSIPRSYPAVVAVGSLCPAIGASWAQWSGWTACSKTCGRGTRTRDRRCNQAENGGSSAVCTTDDSELEYCNISCCRTDGSWGPWTSFSTCTASCGGGRQQRTRTCQYPDPNCKGSGCSGESEDTQSCNTECCRSDGVWKTWGGWSQCSRSCGSGQRSRRRECNYTDGSCKGTACPGSDEQTGNCNNQCPATTTTTTTTTKSLLELGTKQTDLEKECGRLYSGSTTVAKTGEGNVEAPWAVSLGEYQEGEYYHVCGGSIIGPSTVLTAAHCITTSYFYFDTYIVVAGVATLHKASRGRREFSLEKAVVHPRWQSENKLYVYHDAGLIIIKGKFKYTPSIQPICLPLVGHEQLPDYLVGHSIAVVGWGRDNEDQGGKQLNPIYVTIRSDHECDVKYNNTGTRRQMIQVKHELPRLIEHNQFCADNDLQKDIGTCHGDSGGPGFKRSFTGGEDQFTIMGIVSGSRACGGVFPDYYTYVANKDILNWIRQALGEAKDRSSRFKFLSNDSVLVRCETDGDCPLDAYCAEKFCQAKSGVNAALKRRLKPSSSCPEETPCKKGSECIKAKCNRYGDACWCPVSRRSGRAMQITDTNPANNDTFDFVKGQPRDWEIDCQSTSDCPHEWYCAEELCIPPTTFPFAAWESLSVPRVSGLGNLEPSSCPISAPCSPSCFVPTCNSLGKCWCWRARRRTNTRQECSAGSCLVPSGKCCPVVGSSSGEIRCPRSC